MKLKKSGPKKKKNKLRPIKFPAKVLLPVKNFLSKEERRLKKRKVSLAEQDPFEDDRRVSDNAPDIDADEQFGHEKAQALKREVDRKLIQIRKALARIKIGSYGSCEKCNRMINTDRLMVMPEATVCVECEKKKGR